MMGRRSGVEEVRRPALVTNTKKPSEEGLVDKMVQKKTNLFEESFLGELRSNLLILLLYSSYLVLSVLVFGCRKSDDSKKEETSGKLGHPIADKEKVVINHARGFTIDYFDDYKVLTILNPFDKAHPKTEYLLINRGATKPHGFAPAQTIEIPVRQLVAMSSMHVGLVDFAEAPEVLVGLGNLTYVSSPAVVKRIEEGKITEIGRDQGINEEKLVEMQPGLVMTSGSPQGKMERYATLTAAGIPVLINSEWVEQTPLGRAEWVKLVAALLNKEKLVNEKFGKVEAEYKRLVELAASSHERPTLITGMNAKDAWFVPSGDSFMAQFFRDAGASYPWDSIKATGSLPLSFEAVYPIALKADYWLNVSISDVAEKKEVLAHDTRFADFKAFKTSRMYSYNKRINSRGSNDYWESGAVNAHWVLADLIRIMHPQLLPGHELVYYKQIR